MPVVFNIRHLEEKTLLLNGELPVAELDLVAVDELIHLSSPLSYDLQVQLLENGILVQGCLRLAVDCDCARCLKTYHHSLSLDPWACHLALEGEEKVAVNNDLVDLTPYIREDILLSFPQHPLCEPECKGLRKAPTEQIDGARQAPDVSSATWAELNKLKF
jgi:uncharacterized metal-binding protein YceD (DUF177 family)